jgi:hypothetical protein
VFPRQRQVSLRKTILKVNSNARLIPILGGETPINNSVVLYKELKERHPEFIEELEKKGVKYQLFHPNGPRDQVASAGTTVLQAYGQHVLDSDDTETARAKIEKEIRRLPTAEWIWENQSEENPLGDLRVWQHLPGTSSSQPLQCFLTLIIKQLCGTILEQGRQPSSTTSFHGTSTLRRTALSIPLTRTRRANTSRLPLYVTP